MNTQKFSISGLNKVGISAIYKAPKQSSNPEDVESQPLQQGKSKYGSTQDPSTTPSYQETNVDSIAAADDGNAANGHVNNTEGKKPMEPLFIDEHHPSPPQAPQLQASNPRLEVCSLQYI
ncbi:hypothetical protein J6590_056143 [Homalodisca vitripennis]|nr:hypothetical protein J6590_056143 [Homalodisca vitripennis]